MGVNDYIHVGQKIKKARLSRGLSQKEMAALMELPISTYANYEADRREMSTGLISTAALLLDISLADLMGCQYNGVDPQKMIDEYHLEIALNGREKLGYGPYTKFSSSSASELELTKQQEEFIKLSNNLSEEQVARILAYAQAIYDLQSGNQHPAVSIPKIGEKNAAEEAEHEVDRIVAQELAAAKKSKVSIK